MNAPLFAIFKRQHLYNTLTGCLWMGAAFCVYYSIWALFSTYLQKELNWTPGMVATPLFWANIVVFAGSGLWGAVADKWGRRPAIIVPCIIAVFVTPLYLWTADPLWIVFGFILQGVFGGSIYGQNPSYLSERFPTEVRATASGFVYHQGAIWGGLVAPVHQLLRGRAEDGLRHADDGEHHRVPADRDRRGGAGAGDEGQDPHRRSRDDESGGGALS